MSMLFLGSAHHAAMSARRTGRGRAVAVGLLLAAAGTPDGPAAVELLGPAPVSRPVCMALRSDDRCGDSTLLVTDLDGNGTEDVAVNYADDRLYLLLGDGLGGLTRSSDQEATFEGALAAADFNRDGFPDLVAGDFDELRVHLSDGAGGVASTIELFPGGISSAVAAPDLNGDGAPDLAVLRPGPYDPPHLLTTALGDGSGGFSHESSIELPFLPAVLAVGHFNADGNMDIVVGGNEADGSIIRLFLGDGTGSFQAQQDQAAAFPLADLVSADFNQDQALDLALLGSDTVSVLLSNGDGTFAAPAAIPLATTHRSMLADDFNGDTLADLALIGESGGNMTILFGDGLGGFSGSEGFQPLASHSLFGVASGDFNGDGAKDLALADDHFGSIDLLLGDGIGGFLVARDLSEDRDARAGLVSDLDNDGHPDLALASWLTDSVLVFLADGSGSFTRSVVPVGTAPMAIAAGLVNDDQAQDLVVSNLGDDSVTVLLGDGHGGFTRQPDLPVADGPEPVLIADLNGDSRADLAVGHLNELSVGIFLGSGSGSFSHAADIGVPYSPESLAAADFNHDAIMDLVVGFSEHDGRGILVLLGDGHGGYSAVAIPDSMTCSVVTSDFDRDGHVDIAVHGFYGVEIHAGDGLGGFPRSTHLDTFTGAGDPDIPEFCHAMAVADFNADSLPDLAIADGPSTVTVLSGDGMGGLSPTASLQVGPEVRALGAADFDGDSSPDLAVVNGGARLLFNQIRSRIDLNGSNRIDGMDLGSVGRSFGCGRPDSCYDRSADVTLDGLIDGDDLALVSSRFGSLVRTVSPLQARLAPPSAPGGTNTATLEQAASEGDLLTVEVVVDSAAPLASANFALTFDAAVLTFLGASAGDYLAGPGVRQAMAATGASGVVEVSLTRLLQGQASDALLSGPGTLLSLLFKARRAGDAPLSFAPFELPQPALLNAAGQQLAQIDFQAGATVGVGAPQGKPGGPRIGTAPEALDFGSLSPGEESPKKLRISNFGFSELTVNDVTISSTEFRSFFTKAFSIPAFGYVELPVIFAPTREGMHEAELVVGSDDPARASARVRLVGRGTGALGAEASGQQP